MVLPIHDRLSAGCSPLVRFLTFDDKPRARKRVGRTAHVDPLQQLLEVRLAGKDDLQLQRFLVVQIGELEIREKCWGG